MTNHPNRNWRRRMQSAADQWLDTTEARVLIEVPFRPDQTAEALRNRVLRAYLAGYQDGRKRDEP